MSLPRVLPLVCAAVLVLSVVRGGGPTRTPTAAAARPPARPTYVPAGPTVVEGRAPAPRHARWVSPVTPLRVVRGFDPPDVRWGAGHRGVDLAAPAGSAVLAAGDGVVAFAGIVAGTPVVSIDHPDGLRTTYEPVVPAVVVGARVTAGSRVGTVGSPAHCADGCLHWGARRGDTYVDPLALLHPVPVVLLPLAVGRHETPSSTAHALGWA